ncbi:MAG: ribosome assembly factor SBDS [Candidatus Nezhaarchaeota archaeon]|nr:ribosome assembly factor SBDS [Candidatus Nezhaarchaeota archaeon]
MERGVVARLTVGREKFEVLVRPELAWRLRRGEKVDIKEVLVASVVFRDVGKGLKASKEELLKAFKTDDPEKAAEQIVKRGELQLSSEQRKELIEMKRRQIVDFIAKNCIDPRTSLPHPPLRIENALAEAGVSINPFEDAEAQAMEVIKALRPILPLKMAKATLEVKVSANYAKKALPLISKMSSVKHSEWLGDGSWRAEVEVPAGLQLSFIDKLNSLTKGEAQVKVVSVS